MAEPTYAESVRRYRAREQREVRSRWYTFHSNMAELHSRLSQEHERKALALLEGPESKAGKERDAR